MRNTVLLLAIVCVATIHAQTQPARPTDPILVILDALKTHRIVAFSDPHGHPEIEAFEFAVVRDPRIRAVVDDIVIENGNASFQSVMDRYVRGEPVPYDELHHVWHDTTQTQNIGPRDGTIPPLYRLVRELNASAAPPQRRLRVLLGDPPVDWSTVRTAADHRKWIEQREIHGAEVVKREVLAKGHHALVVYGQSHLQRKNLQANYSTDGLAATVGSGIEAAAPGQLFTLWWLTDQKAPPTETMNWPTPSAALLRGTTLGALDFTAFEDAPVRAAIVGDQIIPVPRDQWKNLRMEEQFDALLKLGPVAAVAPTGGADAEATCADKAWVTEWIRRLTLPGSAPGPGPSAATAQRLRQLCGL